MANALTGDFDAVIEVAAPAIDRLLALQHQARSYLHSFTARIDDRAPPPAAITPRFVDAATATGRATPASVGRDDGDRSVAPAARAPGYGPARAVEELSCRYFGGVVWAGDRTGVRGLADVQLSAPRISIPLDGHTSFVTVHFDVRARFTADPGSPPLPEFLHGELQATVDVAEVAAEQGSRIEIDFSAADVEVAFVPAPSSPIAAGERARLEQLLKNQLRQRFKPVSALLPPQIQQLRWRTLPDTAAVLLTLGAPRPSPDPAGVTRVFLDADDDFGFALGRDFVVATLQSMLPPGGIPPFHVSFASGLVQYDVTLGNLGVDLQAGRIVLSVDGHAAGGTFLSPSFDFTFTQAIALALRGDLVVAQPDGDPGLDIHDGLVGWVIGLFKGAILGAIGGQRDQLLAGAQPAIQQALDPRRSLGAILQSLQLAATLDATGLDVEPEGVILRGTITVGALASPHLRFRVNVVQEDGASVAEVDALESWIPGGTIDRFDWFAAAPSSQIDRFVARLPYGSPAPRLCLRLRGRRPTTSGGVVYEAVDGWHCAFAAPTVYLPIPIASEVPVPFNPALRLPWVLSQPGANDGVDVVGYVDLLRGGAAPGGSGTNVVLHFADHETAAAAPSRFAEALDAVAGGVAAVAILVQPAGVAHRLPRPLAPNQALCLAEDPEGAWKHAFAVRELPTTLILDPNGRERWRFVGVPAPDDLEAAFRERFAGNGFLRFESLASPLAEGTAPPDFLFPDAPGRCIALHKLVGQEVVLSFFTSWATPCLAELRRLERLQAARRELVVLAIDDGEPPEVARRFFAEQELRLRLVEDRERSIARAYRIACWPTTVSIDAAGRIANVQLGRSPAEEPAPVRTPGARREEEKRFVQDEPPSSRPT